MTAFWPVVVLLGALGVLLLVSWTGRAAAAWWLLFCVMTAHIDEDEPIERGVAPPDPHEEVRRRFRVWERPDGRTRPATGRER